MPPKKSEYKNKLSSELDKLKNGDIQKVKVDLSKFNVKKLAKRVGVLSEDVKIFMYLPTAKRYYALNDRSIRLERAKITWQENRPFNLYNYKNNKFPYNFPYRVYDKLKRVVSHKYFIQRNWELQFLGKENEIELKNWLFENDNFKTLLNQEITQEFYTKFKNKDSVYFSHDVSMLLTLSLFSKINKL